MKINRTLVYGLFAAALLSSGAVSAGHPDCGQMMKHHHDGASMHSRMLDRMTKELELTEQQQQQIREITTAAKKDFKANRKVMQESRQKIREAAKAGATEAEIQQLLIADTARKAKVIVAATRMHNEIDAVLTEEQRVKHAELKEARKARMKKKFSKHRKEHKEE